MIKFTNSDFIFAKKDHKLTRRGQTHALKTTQNRRLCFYNIPKRSNPPATHP